MANLAIEQQSFIRFTFVDNASTFPPTDIYVDRASADFSQFLAIAYNVTGQFAFDIMSQYAQINGNNSSTQRLPGQGFTLLDGIWYYRLICPFDYTTQVRNKTTGDWEMIRRTGQDKREWTVLDSQDAFLCMISRLMQGNTSAGRWIEIMHKCQFDRDARMQAYNAFHQLLFQQPIGRARGHHPPRAYNGRQLFERGESLAAGSLDGGERGNHAGKQKQADLVVVADEGRGRSRSATM